MQNIHLTLFWFWGEIWSHALNQPIWRSDLLNQCWQSKTQCRFLRHPYSSPTDLNPLVHRIKISQEFLYLWPEDCKLLNISSSLPSSHPKQRKWPFGTMGQHNGDQFECSFCSWWSYSDILCAFDRTYIYTTSKSNPILAIISHHHFKCKYMNEIWSSLETLGREEFL